MNESSTRPIFGPFINVPEKDIEPAGYKCADCTKAVEKLMKFVPGQADFFCIYSCGCTSVGCWELESPPKTLEEWEALAKLQRASDTEIVMLTPKAARSLHREGNREGNN
jgi:hypothetical protein